MSRLAAHLHDHRVRFALVGLGVTGVHFLVLSALLPVAVPETANAVAFVVATQVNFGASYAWTWASRRAPGREGLGRLARRLGLFNASALVAFGVNAAAFTAAHRLLAAPPLASAVLATVLSAAVSFAVSSRLVFARSADAVPATTTLPIETAVVMPPERSDRAPAA